jgi:hypothetical protein
VEDETVSCEKIHASVMPDGLDFQLSFSNGGREIEEILVLRTCNGKYIHMGVHNARGTFGLLAPFLEVRLGSKYEWLTKEICLSSNSGMGTGGVALIF